MNFPVIFSVHDMLKCGDEQNPVTTTSALLFLTHACFEQSGSVHGVYNLQLHESPLHELPSVRSAIKQ